MDSFPGLVAVEAPIPGEHYFGYHLLRALWKRAEFNDPRWNAWLDVLLAEAWGILCCLGQDSLFLLHDQQRAGRYVTAVFDRWSDLNSLDKRFAWGDGSTILWNAAPALWYALRQLGASRSELDEKTNGRAMPRVLADCAAQFRAGLQS